MRIHKSRLASMVAMAAAALFTAGTAHAQTASATLNVSATVTSSLQMVIDTATGGPTLTNSGTTNATLPFGNISAYGSYTGTGVTLVASSDTSHGTCTGTNPCFVVSAPVQVVVNEFNSSSSKFTLSAQLGTADNTNFWAVGTESSAINSTSPTNVVTAGGKYGSTGNVETVYLGVPTATASSTIISNSIDFVVTAN
ncbi:MAG: hypothetical protein ACLGSD_03965 [Acidobacteriota bacterium]